MSDWFDEPNPAAVAGADEQGLRFSCTMCGNCCTGPAGYVLVSEAEIDALALRFGLDRVDFLARYTHMTSKGLSLTESRTKFGLDCIFLDRETIPGKAICGVYEDRPTQCKTWPFWPENLGTKEAWRRAARTCPGMNQGDPVAPQQIRILRDRTAP